MLKKCSCCKQEQDISNFGVNNSTPNGKSRQCAECVRIRSRKKRARIYQQSDRGKELKRIRQNKDYKENKHKHTAKRLVSYLIKIGKLKREPCEVCGETRSFGHHPDYDKPAEVVWLCQKHHSKVHRKQPSPLVDRN